MVPICYIEIGNYAFRHTQQVRIDSGRKSLADTCTITMPRKYDAKNLAALVKEGDKVVVKLSYDIDVMRTEFTGYVSEIGCNTPVEFICEDEMYQLKRQTPKAKSWKATNLKEVLTYLVPGITIEVPGMSLKPYVVTGKKNTYKELEWLKDNLNLDIYFKAEKLFCGLALTAKDSAKLTPVIYCLRKDENNSPNVIDSKSRLRFQDENAIKQRVVCISKDSKNKETRYEYGDKSGAKITLHYYNKTAAELKTIAENKLNTLKFTGYRGNFLAFGIPYIEHSWLIEIRDAEFKERTGRYFCDRLITEFGIEGFRREVYPGLKAGNNG